jgi:hypothetical protein
MITTVRWTGKSVSYEEIETSILAWEQRERERVIIGGGGYFVLTLINCHGTAVYILHIFFQFFNACFSKLVVKN